ncbi:MAG: cysteine hydrolase [Moraxellaceae bacterium]|nr:MAG: cysteine hydrolase [Moraxellaceae bacterium]
MQIKAGTALIIIDQQKGLDYPQLGTRNNLNAAAIMLSLLSSWRKNNLPIIHIKHRSHCEESVFWPGQEGFDVKPDFIPFGNEPIIEKNTPCAFTKTYLEETLHDMGINSLVVVGASTSNSVEATVRTGSCRGFNIIVVEDACFTFSKPDYFGYQRTAQEVHAMSLANLQVEYAVIVHSSDLEFDVAT